MYKIVYKDKFKKILKKIPKSLYPYIDAKIRKIQSDPYTAGDRMTNFGDLWKCRVGTYRILYYIDDDKIVVNLHKIGHRKDVYQKL